MEKADADVGGKGISQGSDCAVEPDVQAPEGRGRQLGHVDNHDDQDAKADHACEEPGRNEHGDILRGGVDGVRHRTQGSEED